MSQENAEVFSKETFLTSLRNSAGGNGHTASTSSIEETPAMAIVREKHAQLHDVVGSLSEKISAVLARQERDFLAAYRAHMYTVQKELHDMREKIHRNETVENKSEKIKKIEDERDWYRKEALRLDAFTTTMTKDLKYMRENLEAIEEDRNWLEKQLKACKKQNKLLRAELDVRLSGNNAGLESGGVLPSFDSQGRASFKQQKRSSQELQGAAAFSPVGGSHGLPHLNLDAASGGQAAEEREEKLKRQIRSLKRELQQKSNDLAALRRQQRLLRHDGGSRQSPLEVFFLQCVESVKEEVGRRRDCSLNPSLDRKALTNQAATRGHRVSTPTEKSRKQKFNVELDDFTSSDRVRLIERLLAHDEVLTFLYNHLFPSDTSITSSGDTMETSSWGSQPPIRHVISSEPAVPTLHTSASLPAASSPFVNFEASNTPNREDVGADKSGDGNRPTTPVGSGAAAVSAVRGGSLSLDNFTKEYLKSVKPAFN